MTAVIASALIYAMPKTFSTVASKLTGVVCVYCRKTELPSVDSGIARIVRCDATDLDAVLSRCSDVDGVSVSFEGSLRDVERIVERLGVKQTHTQQMDGLIVVCGYSRRLRGGVLLDGRFVNVQIALNGDRVTVGSPLILGGY